MFGSLFRAFRKKPVLVPGGASIEEGTSRGIDVGDPLAGGVRVILSKVEGEIYALDARCPHAGGQIQTGPLEKGKFAVCPLHWYLFDPKTGKPENVACAPAKRYRARQRGNDVEVFI